MNFLFHLYT